MLAYLLHLVLPIAFMCLTKSNTMKQPLCLQAAGVLLAVFLCTNLNAQQSTIDYDLRDYKLPYLKRHTL